MTIEHVAGSIEADFEPEDIGEQQDNEKPFDPKKVDIAIQTPNLGSLITRLENNEIDLMPEFQRELNLWSKQAQSRLIESILIRLPIPAFYFDASDEEKWQVVDGLQRLCAINNFVVKKDLALTNLEFLVDYEGCTFEQLPRSYSRRIDEFQTSVYLIKAGTPTLMKYSLFNRINTGGLKLTPQEIRHAMSQSVRNGAASSFLTEIVKHDSFQKVVSNKNNRMIHQELVLRHMAFTLLGTENYKSSLPRFLDSAMIELGKIDFHQRVRLSANFLSAMELAHEIFGHHAFKRSLAGNTSNKVINKPLFESLSVCLAKTDEFTRSTLIENKDEFKLIFTDLLKNSDFETAITRSTANTESVQNRMRMITVAIAEFTLQGKK